MAQVSGQALKQDVTQGLPVVICYPVGERQQFPGDNRLVVQQFVDVTDTVDLNVLPGCLLQ